MVPIGTGRTFKVILLTEACGMGLCRDLDCPGLWEVLGTCFLICWCPPRASPLVPFPAADVEMSLHFWTGVDVVRECWKADGRASRLWEAVWGAAWVAELCQRYLFSGHWVLEEVGHGSVTGPPYSQTQNLMERLTFRCLVGMPPGLCLLLMPNAFEGLATHFAPELSTWFSDQ